MFGPALRARWTAGASRLACARQSPSNTGLVGVVNAGQHVVMQSTAAAAESPNTTAGFAGAAGPAASSPRVASNLQMDDATVRMIDRRKQADEKLAASTSMANVPTSVPVVDLMTAKPTGQTVEIDPRIASTPIRVDIVHRVIVWQDKNNRKTLYMAKNRSEVRGGGKKPWKQKGTGRARAGSIRSPIWKGGGLAHPPKLREWGIGLQKKVRRFGMRVALAAKLRDGRLTIVPSLAVPEGKTKEALAFLQAHGVEGKRTLWVGEDGALPPAFRKAISNIQRTSVLPAIGANVKDIVSAERLFITPAALAAVTQRITRED